MNYRELHKQVGTLMRLRPYAILADPDLQHQSKDETLWLLQTVHDSPKGVSLIAETLGLTLDIPGDQLQNFQTPNVLWLRCQILIDSDGPHFESIPSHVGQSSERGRLQIDLPVGNSSHLEWTPIHGSGAPPDTAIMIFTRLVNGRQLWLQPGAVEPDEEGRWVHPAVNLHANSERYVFALAVAARDVLRARALFGPGVVSVSDLQRLLDANGLDDAVLSPPKLLDRVDSEYEIS